MLSVHQRSFLRTKFSVRISASPARRSTISFTAGCRFLIAVAGARAVDMALNGNDLHCHVVPALEPSAANSPSPSTTRMDSSPSTSALLTATTTSKSVRQSLLLALRDNPPRRNAHVTRLGRHSIHERYLVPINPHRPDRAVIAAPANYRVPFVFLNNRTQIGSTICANNMLQRGANYLGGNLLLCRPLIKSGRRGEDCGSAVFKTPYQAFGALALTELNRSGYVKYNPPRHDSTRSN